ncbi:hypothetical protein KJ644_03455 [Candidatus Dependentiae bacterium]|nr:hypothetical protein [Candidatus Dependentiae bacterium]MBU4387503.1 hypothetical protein [Candidatus Dependentiae bacterium]
MKNLSKIIFALSLSLFAGQAFSMNDIEKENDGINVKLKRLNLDEFLDTFPGVEKEKTKVAKYLDVFAVEIKNDNYNSYLISSNIQIPEELREIGGYSKLESFCDNGCKSFAVLSGLLGVGVAGAFIMTSMSFHDFGVTQSVIISSIPVITSILSYLGVKSCCIDRSKNNRDEKIEEFFKENVIIPDKTVVKANSTIVKYCLSFKGLKNYNLTFVNVDNLENQISFDFFKDDFRDEEVVEELNIEKIGEENDGLNFLRAIQEARD